MASGICGGQSGVGVGFLRVLQFPLSKTVHSTNFSILTITRSRYNRPINGRCAEWTQYGLHPPIKKKKKLQDLAFKKRKFSVLNAVRTANPTQLRMSVN
jgi:hypothetical protein